MPILNLLLFLLPFFFRAPAFVSASYAQQEQPPKSENGLRHLRLNATSGQTIHLAQTDRARATVFVFLSPECPLSQNYTLPLQQLHQTFGKREVLFFGVVPGKDFPLREIKRFEKTYPLPYPVLLDPDLTLTKLLRASVTPEAVVVDAAGQTLYQGQIDNWAYALGKKRQVVTEHYLREALMSHLQQEAVPVPRTKAVGCLIQTRNHD